MPQNEYQIRLTAQIEIGGTFSGNDRDEAIVAAQSELRSQGEIADVVVESCIYIDPNPNA